MTITIVLKKMALAIERLRETGRWVEGIVAIVVIKVAATMLRLFELLAVSAFT